MCDVKLLVPGIRSGKAPHSTQRAVWRAQLCGQVEGLPCVGSRYGEAACGCAVRVLMGLRVQSVCQVRQHCCRQILPPGVGHRKIVSAPVLFSS